jgi:hypothetical protein
MRKTVSILLIISLVFGAAGCAGMQRKFTRKKKDAAKKPRIYQLKKYEKKPTPELYKKHYAWWMSWQSEILSTLGKNHKKDMSCIEQIVSNLRDMQSLLVPEKADELEPHIARLDEVKNILFKEDLTQFNRTYVTMTLEREERYVKKNFYYKKIKDYLRQSFDDEFPAGN